ncbi:MAG: LysR family transcriptional regulator [Pseudarcicella sp.]|nr:LysR family transcriptional regulator [Pseudarcicella sp.]MBP6409583.1 LysR family transcriptional regulator [Pseudarcicella sp.]
MTITQLEYIIAVDNYKNFVKASKSCCITQPTLSMQIQKLEDELNTKIFDRSKHPIVCTPIGLEIVNQARLTLSEFQKIENVVNQDKKNLSGELKIGVIPTLAPYLLPLFLNNFIEKYPDINLKVREQTTQQITEGLITNKLDIGLMATPLQNKVLKETPIFQEELLLYVSQENALYQKKYAVSQEIDPAELWLLEEGHCLRSQIENLCELRKHAITKHQFEYQAGSLETLIKMVDRNNGITILPELCTLDFEEKRQKQVRHFVEPAPVREISLVCSVNYNKNAFLKALKETIINVLPENILNKTNQQIVHFT